MINISDIAFSNGALIPTHTQLLNAKNFKDLYHKITNQLSNEFDLIVAQSLQAKNMTEERAKLKMV